MTVVVRRSALRMWLIAMGGIPLLVISLDVLTNRRLTDWLRGLIFRPEDTQIFEPRDVIWAWAMALFAAFVVLWGLKELFVPTKVLECTDEGLSLRLRGPFRPNTMIPWERLNDISGGTLVDEDDRIPVLEIHLLSREGVPPHPWGARWTGDRTLSVLAEDWTQDPEKVARAVADYAVEAARREARARTARLWEET